MLFRSADVTGDNRPDLVLLCHDRILIYPQDGPGAELTVEPKAGSPKPAVTPVPAAAKP